MKRDKCLKVTVNDPEIEKLVLYKLTEHPDARKLLAMLETGAQIYVFQIRSVDTDIAEVINVNKSKLKGTLDDKPGIHPKMEKYFKEVK